MTESEPENMDLTAAGAKIAIKAADEASSLIRRAFGPAADEFGITLATRVRERRESKTLERQQHNLEKVAGAADRNSRADKLRAEISPRVAKKLIEEACFAESEILTEYIGGVLASARDHGAGNDASIECIDLISRLTSQTLRLHYIFYREVLELRDRRRVNFYDGTECVGLEIFLEGDGLANALISPPPDEGIEYNYSPEVNSAITSLSRAGLVENPYGGDLKFLKTRMSQFEHDGVVATPTAYGVQLYLTAFGYGNKELDEFFTIPIERLTIPTIPRVFAERIAELSKRPAHKDAD